MHTHTGCTIQVGCHLSFYQAGAEIIRENFMKGSVISVTKYKLDKSFFSVYVLVMTMYKQWLVVQLHSNETFQYITCLHPVRSRSFPMGFFSYVLGRPDLARALSFRETKNSEELRLLAEKLKKSTAPEFQCLLDLPAERSSDKSSTFRADKFGDGNGPDSPDQDGSSRSPDRPPEDCFDKGADTAGKGSDDRTGDDRTGDDCTGHDRTGHDRTGHVPWSTVPGGRAMGKPKDLGDPTNPKNGFIQEQTAGSVDCGPLMVQAIHSLLVGGPFLKTSSMQADEAEICRGRQTLVIMDHEVDWLNLLRPFTASDMERARLFWFPTVATLEEEEFAHSYASIKPDVSWAALRSLKPDHLVHEETMDACLHYVFLKSTNNVHGVSVVFMNQLLQDISEDRRCNLGRLQYLRAVKSLKMSVDQLHKCKRIVFPVCLDQHYFAVVVKQVSGMRNVYSIFDSMAWFQLDKPRNILCQHIADFLKTMEDTGLKRLIDAQGWSEHASRFGVASFVFDRIGTRMAADSTLRATMLTKEKLTTMLDRAGYSYKSSYVSGHKCRETMLATLSYAVNNDINSAELLDQVHARLIMIARAEVPPDPCKESFDLYHAQMSIKAPLEYGGEFEVNRLAQQLGCPIIIFLFAPNDTDAFEAEFKCELVYGKDQTGLPIFLGLLYPESPYGCHYVLLVPKSIPEYRLELHACERLVEVHAPEIHVQLGDKVISFEIFGPLGNGNCLFEAVSLAHTSRRPEFQQGGDSFPCLLTRKKHIDPVLTRKLKEFTDLGYNKTVVRQLRRLSDTSSGGHAYDEHTPASVIKKALVASDFGVGTDIAGTVVADLGVGSGVILMCQYMVSAPDTVCIGMEIEPTVHQNFIGIQRQLMQAGWPGAVATRNFNSSNIVSFEGIHIVHLYDGTASTKALDKVDQKHARLIGRLFATQSMDVVSTTKASHNVIPFYAAHDDNVRKYLSQFTIVLLNNCPLSGSRMFTTMYIRKKIYRIERGVGGAAGETDSLIQQLIRGAAATYTDEPVVDLYGRFQSIQQPLDPTRYALAVPSDDSQQRCCLVGSKLTQNLRGLTFTFGDTVMVGTNSDLVDEVVSGVYVGIVTVPKPTSEQYDDILVYMMDVCAIWIVPVTAVARVDAPDAPPPAAFMGQLMAGLKRADIKLLKFPFGRQRTRGVSPASAATNITTRILGSPSSLQSPAGIASEPIGGAKTLFAIPSPRPPGTSPGILPTSPRTPDRPSAEISELANIRSSAEETIRAVAQQKQKLSTAKKQLKDAKSATSDLGSKISAKQSENDEKAEVLDDLRKLNRNMTRQIKRAKDSNSELDSESDACFSPGPMGKKRGRGRPKTHGSELNTTDNETEPSDNKIVQLEKELAVAHADAKAHASMLLVSVENAKNIQVTKAKEEEITRLNALLLSVKKQEDGELSTRMKASQTLIQQKFDSLTASQAEVKEEIRNTKLEAMQQALMRENQAGRHDQERQLLDISRQVQDLLRSSRHSHIKKDSRSPSSRKRKASRSRGRSRSNDLRQREDSRSSDQHRAWREPEEDQRQNSRSKNERQDKRSQQRQDKRSQRKDKDQRQDSRKRKASRSRGRSRSNDQRQRKDSRSRSRGQDLHMDEDQRQNNRSQRKDMGQRKDIRSRSRSSEQHRSWREPKEDQRQDSRSKNERKDKDQRQQRQDKRSQRKDKDQRQDSRSPSRSKNEREDKDQRQQRLDKRSQRKDKDRRQDSRSPSRSKDQRQDNRSQRKDKDHQRQDQRQRKDKDQRKDSRSQDNRSSSQDSRSSTSSDSSIKHSPGSSKDSRSSSKDSRSSTGKDSSSSKKDSRNGKKDSSANSQKDLAANSKDPSAKRKEDQGVKSKEDQGARSKGRSAKRKEDQGTKSKGRRNKNKEDQGTKGSGRSAKSKGDQGANSEDDHGTKATEDQGTTNKAKKDQGKKSKDDRGTGTKSNEDQGTKSKEDQGDRGTKDPGGHGSSSEQKSTARRSRSRSERPHNANEYRPPRFPLGGYDEGPAGGYGGYHFHPGPGRQSQHHPGEYRYYTCN